VELREAESEVAATSSADEMTVNALAEKKRRLLSRVLAPTKRGKFDTRWKSSSPLIQIFILVSYYSH
jgi:hypothetical protein